MSTDLTRRAEPGALATVAPIDQFRLLDAFSGGLVEPRKQQPTLATISAGYNANAGKEGGKRPVVSRDGMIYIDGRSDLALAYLKVPGLARALEAGQRKRLTITFPWDDPELFIRQHLTCRSASRLQVYGDHTGLTRIHHERVDPETGERTALPKPIHEFYAAGSPGWEALLPYIKCETSVYFFLAGWDGGVAQVMMPDGMGLYRLRMTSHNSAHNIVNSLKWLSKLTGGRFAGVPFDLWHEPTEVPGPDGARRVVPVWNLFPRPPEALALSAANFQEIFGGALRQGDRLKILPPPIASADALELEGPADDAPILDGRRLLDGEEAEAEQPARPAPTAEQQAAFNAAMRGGLCDPSRARRVFFGTYGDTVLNEPGPRAAMVREYSRGATSSLGEYLADATEGEAAGLIAFGKLWLARQAEAQRPRRVLAGHPVPVQPDDAPEPRRDPGLDEVEQALDEGRDGEAERLLDQVLDRETGEIAEHAQAGPAFGSPAQEESPLELDDPPDIAPPEDLDLLSVCRQRRDALEQAPDLPRLNLAWSDVEQDRDYLGQEATRVLLEVFTVRRAAIAAGEAPRFDSGHGERSRSRGRR